MDPILAAIFGKEPAISNYWATFFPCAEAAPRKVPMFLYSHLRRRRQL